MPSSAVPLHLSESPLKRLEKLRSKNLLLIFYRGEWCPFSTTWARGLCSIRGLSRRLERTDATAVLISSQGVDKEQVAADSFGFTEASGLNQCVYFVNDPENEIACRLNAHCGRVVVNVDAVSQRFGGGVRFSCGMVQPTVLVARDLFNKGQVVPYYSYSSSGPKDINGEADCPPAVSTLRAVERITSHWPTLCE